MEGIDKRKDKSITAPVKKKKKGIFDEGDVWGERDE